QQLVDRRELRRRYCRVYCRRGERLSRKSGCELRQRAGNLAKTDDALLQLHDLRRQSRGRQLAERIGELRERGGDLSETGDVLLDAREIDLRQRRGRSRRCGWFGGHSCTGHDVLQRLETF